MSELAIVIPAYKSAYFDKALSSLASQTNKNFKVYIGDDCSPSDLKSIVDKYQAVLDIEYTRFNNNIGAKDLVKQWRRCVELTKEEKWIWLFSDDDIVDNTCVENFFLKLSTDKVIDVYRFNTVVIDAEGYTLDSPPIGPDFESSEEMGYNLLLGRRGNSIADHIFSKAIYNKKGGFVFTEFAQGADWASSILFSSDKGISIIPHSNFYWRRSGLNISTRNIREKNKMLNGHLQFIRWILNHFKYLKYSTSKITFQHIRMAARANLKSVILFHYRSLTIRNYIKVIYFMITVLNLSFFQILKDIYVIVLLTLKKKVKKTLVFLF